MVAFRARILALVAAIALMLPSGAAAGAHYFCRMAERVLPNCCCAAAHDEHESGHEVQVRGAGCCEQMLTPARAGATAANDAALELPAAGLATVLPAAAWPQAPVSRLRAARARSRAPPGVGPPLFIVHCAFLS
jgi:hypothetical protein